MYRNFFSLSELPFSISPDPKYLFMSDRHREALTHLTYGLGEVGGFALLTGEVGTGKTTISRCLMEQLPDNTQAAFILNPTLSSQELLATLCDQLKIRYRKTDASLKNLTDKISEKLLKNHANDINTLLIIDEAQHLQPEVLEQLRLLTNLETNTKKLLQVILIGQPELQQLLQRRDLRQLAQRITARYHLMPLTKQELNQYIQHRLTVADCARALFDKGALKKVHQLSQGVPRLTNLLCHSALMQAYNQNDSVVNKKTVIAAADRALGGDIISKKGSFGNNGYNPLLILSTALSFTAFVALASYWWGQSQTATNDILVKTAEKTVLSAREEVTNIEKLVKVVDPLKSIAVESKVEKAKEEEAAKVTDTALEPVIFVTSAAKQNKASAGVSTDTQVITAKEAASVSPKHEQIKAQPVVKTVKQNHKDNSLLVSAKNNSQAQQYKSDVDYKVTEVDGVSSDLLARFQAAIDETGLEKTESNNPYEAADKTNDESAVKSITQMPEQLQNSLPSLQFEQHIYSSDGSGWVNVNGRDRYEGDYIGNNLVVEKILPQQVILSFKGEKFSLPALTNW